MQPVDESAVPAASRARQAFIRAMDGWDESAADAAVTGLARAAGANEVFELFFHYGCRDFRSIGHKAIFVSSASRTLECMGWRHAEPVVRSLAYALLTHHREPNPAESDLEPDRPWKRNRELASKIRPDWLDGKLDDAATAEMLSALRDGSADAACDQVVELLNRGIGPQSIWDALLGGAGELLMRQPGIIALHALTSSNALRYAYETSQNDATRRMLLLQNAAFLPLFRETMRVRGKLGDSRVDRLEPISPEQVGPGAIEEILADVSGDRMTAARKVLGYLQKSPAEPLIDAARRLVFLKGRNSHDYKFSSAVLEDCYRVSPRWRGPFLAAAVFNLRGSAGGDNPLVERTRSALKG
jgi:hypothetical protein